MTILVDLTGDRPEFSLKTFVEQWTAGVRHSKIRVRVDEDHILDLTHVFLCLQAEDNGTKFRKIDLEIVSSDPEDGWLVRDLLSSPGLHKWINNERSVFSKKNKWPEGLISGPSQPPSAILPLVEINNDSYAVLGKSVGDVLQIHEGRLVVDPLDNGVFARQHKFRNSATVRMLSRTFSDYVGSGRLKTSLDTLFSDLCLGNMNMLSFLLFCALCQELDAEQWDDRLTRDNFAQLQMAALDASEALLQLAENVILHAGTVVIADDPDSGGRGFMAVRIHRRDSFDRLKRAYPRYMAGHDNRTRRGARSDWDCYAEGSTSLPEAAKDHPQKRGHDSSVGPLPEDEQERHSRMERILFRQSHRLGETDKGAVAHIEARIMDLGRGADLGRGGMVATFRNAVPGNGPDNGIDRVAGFFDPDPSEQKFWEEWVALPGQVENVVHHYGLTLVDSLVKGLDGCLIVRSGSGLDEEALFSSSGDVMTTAGRGTCVASLIPVRLGALPATGLSDIGPVKWDLKTKWNVQEIDEVVPRFKGAFEKAMRSMEKDLMTKARSIGAVAESLKTYNLRGETITVFNGAGLKGPVSIELLAKSVTLWIAEHQDSRLNVAVTNCDRWQFLTLARMFIAFYDRAGNSNVLKDAQLYIVGTEPQDEFWLGGESLSAAVITQLRLNASRGVGGASMAGLTSQLTQSLARRTSVSDDVSKTSPIVPFDLFVPVGGFVAPFERNALAILNGSMRDSRNGGLKIEDVHVGLGSKVHADAFYEAHLLFRSPHYVDRYAWLISEVLKKENVVPGKPALIVGYETYSTAIVDRLAMYGEESWMTALYTSGGLSQDRSGPTYQIKWDFPLEKESKELDLVIIVPVATTMTTFRKIKKVVERKVGSGSNMPERNLRIRKTKYVTLCRVAPGNSQEAPLVKRFFGDAITETTGQVTYSRIPSCLLGIDVLAIHTVKSLWHDPLTCDQCYPPEKLADERPLESTATSPVVLDLVFGSKE